MGSMLSIGLMSGTSLDGIDAALIETDGIGLVWPMAFRCEQWSDEARAQLAEASRQALTFARPRASPDLVKAGALVDRMHVMAVRKLLVETGVTADRIGVVGYHGQTVAHRPDRGWTWQVGDGAVLAQSLKITTVSDFRSNDVAHGGQGAPLLPVYHRALIADLEKPVAVLNLGGVGNITWIGEGDAIVAFDTGPANSLIDDWVAQETGGRFDEGGTLAGSGRVDEGTLTAMLDNPFFDEAPPKSLDRSDFSIQPARGLSAADGAATLTAFTAETVALALRLLPSRPKRIIVAGGGRHNPALMAMLSARCNLGVEPVEALGANGDATEAEGFAYMAVRVLNGQPVSFPGTTGVAEPMTGGVVHRPL
ncbi:anhydro-N-acetylmuramic acid kinase [Sphingomonas sp.]|uniref:anhydro-N-acetylmuramic acid kinase n=1 Tax=Sphingomonas sp. TaxID=28214 RepID=UPI002600022B|nr:anhydro-N-acetylmuramic acid kinase [Sphingomonas sp.]